MLVHKFLKERFSTLFALFKYTLYTSVYFDRKAFGMFSYLLLNSFDLSPKCRISKPKEFPVTLTDQLQNKDLSLEVLHSI